MDTVGLRYPAAVSITFDSDGKVTTLTGTVVGLDVPVLVKFDSLVFSGAVPLSGNLSFVKGSPGKVLADLVPKFGENGTINYVHVAGGDSESIVVVSTSSKISVGYPCITL